MAEYSPPGALTSRIDCAEKSYHSQAKCRTHSIALPFQPRPATLGSRLVFLNLKPISTKVFALSRYPPRTAMVLGGYCFCDFPVSVFFAPSVQASVSLDAACPSRTECGWCWGCMAQDLRQSIVINAQAVAPRRLEHTGSYGAS